MKTTGRPAAVDLVVDPRAVRLEVSSFVRHWPTYALKLTGLVIFPPTDGRPASAAVDPTDSSCDRRVLEVEVVGEAGAELVEHRLRIGRSLYHDVLRDDVLA